MATQQPAEEIQEDAMKTVTSADKKPQNYRKPDGTMGTRMVPADPKKAPPAAEGKMDPVGQADADIDNDGDVDKSDKYLHNRRKAIKKAITKKKDPQGENGDTATMNPKKESTIRSRLLSIFEGDRAKHYKGAAEAETMDDKYKGNGAKKMKKDHEGPTVDIEKQSHDDASKAGRAVKAKAKARSGNDAVNSGDQNIVNPVKENQSVYTKKQGEVNMNKDFNKTIAAYLSMYETKEEALDELSKGTLGGYIKKAGQSHANMSTKASSKDGTAKFGSDDEKSNQKRIKKVDTRGVGINRAINKLVKKEGSLGELSKKTIGSYVKKAIGHDDYDERPTLGNIKQASSMKDKQRKHSMLGTQYTTSKDGKSRLSHDMLKKMKAKRKQGIATAVKKLQK